MTAVRHTEVNNLKSDLDIRVLFQLDVFNSAAMKVKDNALFQISATIQTYSRA